MKQSADVFTPDLLGPPRRGRPRKPDALTPAQRARRYRARKRDDGREPFTPAIYRPLTDDEVMMMSPDELRAITGNTIDCCRAWIAEARGKWMRANCSTIATFGSAGAADTAESGERIQRGG